MQAILNNGFSSGAGVFKGMKSILLLPYSDAGGANRYTFTQDYPIIFIVSSLYGQGRGATGSIKFNNPSALLIHTETLYSGMWTRLGTTDANGNDGGAAFFETKIYTATNIKAGDSFVISQSSGIYFCTNICIPVE